MGDEIPVGDEQVSMTGLLLPEERPVPEHELVMLDQVVGELSGPDPSTEFVESVLRFGVLQPIAVVWRMSEAATPGHFEVIDGRRRVKAARTVGLERIPAYVYDADAIPSSDVLLLAMNELRSSNPIAELEAIERLVEKGASLKEITKATGLPPATIDRRLRLRAVPPSVRAAVKAGTVALSVAEEMTKLPGKAIDRLVAKLDEKGKLQMPDVRAERHIRTGGAVAKLPEKLFEKDDALWKEEVIELLERCVKLIPTKRDVLRANLSSVAQGLKLGKKE